MLLKTIWEKYDQFVTAVLGFLLGFMARGVLNWLIGLPWIGWMFK